MTDRRTTAFVLALGAMLGLAAPLVAQTEVKRGRNLFSRDQDIEIGQESAKEAEREFPLLQDAEVQRYIADLGARLAAQAPGYDFPYSFKVVNVSDINAFALPGGPIYINRGTIEQARTEGELAGVLAHEISHVDLRHGTRQVTKAVAGQLGLSLLGALIGSGGTTGQIIDSVGGFGMNALFLKYSRSAETDSDILGSQILARAGYHPREMATFFELLEQQSSRRTTDFFSSHPAPDRRRERIEKEAALLSANPPPMPQDRFRAVQERLRRMPAAPSAEELAKNRQPGGGAGSGLPTTRPATVEAPSRALAWYRSASGLFRIAHPDNWDVISQGDMTVTITARGGAYESRDGVEITHGVLAGVLEATSGSRVTLDAATDAFLADLRRDSPYLRPLSGPRERVTVDNGNGLVTTLVGASPTSRLQERASVVTTQLPDGRLTYMIFVRPEDAPAEYEQLLAAMIRNFRVAGR